MNLERVKTYTSGTQWVTNTRGVREERARVRVSYFYRCRVCNTYLWQKEQLARHKHDTDHHPRL